MLRVPLHAGLPDCVAPYTQRISGIEEHVAQNSRKWSQMTLDLSVVCTPHHPTLHVRKSSGESDSWWSHLQEQTTQVVWAASLVENGQVQSTSCSGGGHTCDHSNMAAHIHTPSVHTHASICSNAVCLVDIQYKVDSQAAPSSPVSEVVSEYSRRLLDETIVPHPPPGPAVQRYALICATCPFDI